MTPAQTHLKPVLNMIREISGASRIKHSRNYADFLSDRIVQAATEPGLFGMMERLCKLMDADPGELNQESIKSAFIAMPDNRMSHAVLSWIREYPRVIGMLSTMKKNDYETCLESIPFDPEFSASATGTALVDTGHAINIEIKCLSPLAHGSDIKAGNATLFRRMQVMTTDGHIIALPYYAGNAFRGQMRDLLADDFISRIGLNPRRDKPEINLWFYHALYSGGSLCEANPGDRAIRARLGGNGSIKAKGIYEFRNTLPALSLLGCALGNRILSGRFKISDFRPRCREWGNGDLPAEQLFDWTYLTRREDHEDHENNSAMIATCECLKAGTSLIGGIDPDMHAMPNEMAALGHGLSLMIQNGYIGADNRRGMGHVTIAADIKPEAAPYVEYLETKGKEIRDYLVDIGAIGHESSD